MSLLSTTVGDERVDPIPDALGPDGRYRDLRPLGTGGAGRVFVALDGVDGRAVALKELRGLSPRAIFRIKREFRTLAGLQHRNIVAVHELFMHDGALWYAMELVDGQDVVTYCRTGPPGHARLAAIAPQLVDAIASLHASGLLHRDLKPDNLLVTEAGRVVVLDFGVVKNLADVEREGVTQDRGWVGTPAYMAPEQFVRARPDPAADWYAVGAVLYECLTGAPAFDQPDVGRMLDAKCTARFPSLASFGASPELAALIASLLDPDPRRRAGVSQIREVVGEVSHSAFEPMTDTLLLGRAEEMAALDRALASCVRTGRAHVVSISASPGTGRSRVVAELRDALRGQARAVVAFARAHALESLRMPTIDGLIDDLLGHAGAYGSLDLARCQPRGAPALVASFPTAAVAFKLTPEEEAACAVATLENALDALVEALQRVASQAPLVLLVDDLHACDADELDAIVRVILGASESPVLVVTTHATGVSSTGDVDASVAHLAAHLGADRVTRMPLRGLSADSLAALARSDLAVWRVPVELIERISELSAGSPRLCRWYARELARADVEVSSASGDGLGEALVAQAIADRSPAARRALTLLALADGELPRAALSGLLGGGDELAAITTELEHAHALLRRHYVDAEVVRAWHGGIAEHLLRGISPEAAKAEHRALAEVLTALGVEHEERAERHWRRAGEEGRADALAVRVAARARRQGRHHRAVRVLADLVPRVEDRSARAVLQAELVDSLGHVGRHREAAERAANLLRTGSLSVDAQAAMQLAAVRNFAALARADVVRELVGTPARGGPMAMARLVAARTRIEVRKPWRRPALQAAPTEAQRRELDLLWTAGARLIHVAPIDAATWLARYLELAFATGDAFHRAVALAYEAVMSTSSGGGQLTRASTLLSLAERTAGEVGDPRCRAHVHHAAGFMWGNLGRFREALDEGRQAVALFESLPQGDPTDLAHARVELGWRLLMLGDLREVLATAASRIRDAVQCGDPVLATALYVQCANASLAAGRPAEAMRNLEEGARYSTRAYEVGRFAWWMARYAVDVYEGRPEAAVAQWRRSNDEIMGLRILSLPAVRLVVNYSIGTMLSHASAARGGDRELDREVVRIARELTGAGLDISTAHGCMLEAAIAASRGDRDASAGLVREASVRYAAIGWTGMSLLSRRAHLQQLGLPPDRSIDEALAANGVVDPDRWWMTLVPHLRLR